MATCKKILVEPEFELRLTAREAEVLVSVAAGVGGMPGTPRGDMDRISRALREAGAQDWEAGAQDWEGGSISF